MKIIIFDNINNKSLGKVYKNLKIVRLEKFLKKHK